MSRTTQPTERELPPLSDLNEEQKRGRSCVWCDTALDNATAVNLGRRPYKRLGHIAYWFPRSCGSCEHGGPS